MSTRGKKYQEAAKLVDRQKRYLPDEAVGLVKNTSPVAFDATVEIHLRMGADPRHADQQVRSVAMLPHGTGRQVRVLVFTQGDGARRAKEGGADYVADDDMIKRIEGGWVDFDVAIATPDVMGKVGRLGRVLGRRGLMPNPRSGTVVQPEDIARSIDEARKGRVEFRLDRTGVIHGVLGKVSFEEEELLENMATFVEAVNAAKPSGVKGAYIRSAAMASAMGPSVRLDVPALATMKT
jgi:large subunit ribosomal protein L1